MRFREEVQLLQEEQRRILVTLEKTAKQWTQRAEEVTWIADAAVQNGAQAYGARQAAVYCALSEKFSALWAQISLSTSDETADEDVEEDVEEDLADVEYIYSDQRTGDEDLDLDLDLDLDKDIQNMDLSGELDYDSEASGDDNHE